MTMTVQQHLLQLLQPAPLRACQLCTHGCTSGGRVCTCPALQREATTGTQALRAFGGACGPDAKHLAMPGVTTV